MSVSIPDRGTASPSRPRRPSLLACAAAFAALLLPFAAAAQPKGNAPQVLPVSAEHARTWSAEDGALTPPSAGSRTEIVTSFVRQRLGERAARSLVARGEHASKLRGITHLRFGQQVGGLEVYGAYVKAAVGPDGRVERVVENLLVDPPKAPLRARLQADDALAIVVHDLFGNPDLAGKAGRRSGHTVRFDDAGGFFHRGPAVTRVAVPLPDGTVAEGFLVETWTQEDNLLHHTVVGPKGELLYRELRTNTDTYKIFPDHPGNSTQTVVSGPGSGNTESPIGWVTSNTTIGNNVDAYLDRDNNNAADSGGRPVSASQTFEYTANLSLAPTNSTNQMAAVANLFYLNNVIHDKLYSHGFTESAGNFQSNNFGNGGSGGDPVNAEAQDGGGTNNANFATPADGSRPRMQMYLWNQSSPNRDGDFDSDIVWHEYGHGLTWRMIGGMSGPLAGAIGEGMGDVLSIYFNRDDVVGEYAYNNGSGIRRYAYGNYPLTYGDVGGSSVHNDGEIYAATMWRLLDLWETAGYSQDELYDVVIDGMNYTPSRPAYEDMRDGLLAASPTQAKDCLIWDAFAEFGIGQGAAGQEQCFWIFCFGVNVTESFTTPTACN